MKKGWLYVILFLSAMWIQYGFVVTAEWGGRLNLPVNPVFWPLTITLWTCAFTIWWYVAEWRG